MSSVQYVIDAPIFGHGIGSFGVLYVGEDIRSYPHNIVLELGVEGGLVAVILFAAFSGWCLLCAVHNRHRDPHLIGVTVAVWVYLFANAMVTGDLSTNRMLFAGTALLLAISSIQPHPVNPLADDLLGR
ncbi:hypothetical protein HYG81_24345 (plasmid) [Natrinema zhouii]|uniref:O-antigen ligase family protein n=1 Tax=Natrinema zhouii TaxID=1710539 RepID=UPI001D00065C|nr:hypothetical protein [Natrinema zhouii]UHQ98899.1 hypothetical protein HYG81_24345 [Natrinema zhouii]